MYKNYVNVAKQIIKDRINEDNIDDCIKEFERMITDKHDGNVYEFYDDNTIRVIILKTKISSLKKEVLRI